MIKPLAVLPRPTTYERPKSRACERPESPPAASATAPSPMTNAAEPFPVKALAVVNSDEDSSDGEFGEMLWQSSTQVQLPPRGPELSDWSTFKKPPKLGENFKPPRLATPSFAFV